MAYLKSPVSIGSTMTVPSSPVLMLLYLLGFSVIMENVCSLSFVEVYWPMVIIITIQGTFALLCRRKVGRRSEDVGILF